MKGKSNGLSLKDFRQGNGGKERRRESRHCTGRIISIFPCVGKMEAGFQKVELVDCSAHGIGIVSPQPMAVGDHLWSS